MQPCYADGTSQTERNGAGDNDQCSAAANQQRISRIRATLVEPISRRKQDRLAVNRRVSLSRVLSAFLVASTTASCFLLQRSGVVDLALGRMGVAVIALLWFMSTFTEAFWRDTRGASDGISLLCFLLWSFSHIMWRAVSSEAAGGSSSSGGNSVGDAEARGATPAWVWVDVGIAWATAPVAGGSLQLSLWRSIVPSWLCVTAAMAFGLRAEEVALDGEAADGAFLLVAAVAVFGVAILAVGYQVLWEQARDARALMALEDSMSAEDHRKRQAAFSELLLKHLVTEPSLQVLGAGVKELFRDARIFVMHSDALEQIQDGVNLLTDYGEKALKGLKSGASELPAPVLEKADMEEILDACLRTTAYLAVSRDHHKVQLDLRVASDVNKSVRTYCLWLSQMTRACLIHALHPDEKESVILRVSYARPGWMRIGVEALWRVAGPLESGDGSDGAAGQRQGGRRTLSGWDRDMPSGAWWVRAAALALGGEADYDRSKDREGFHELWFTIPAENIPDGDVQTLPTNGTNPSAASVAGAGSGDASPAGTDASLVAAAAAAAAATRALCDDSDNDVDGDMHRRGQEETDQVASLPQPLSSGRGENLQAAAVEAAAAGAERAARRASRRESTKATMLAPLASAAGAVGAGAGVGASLLPRPGGWATSVVPPLSSPSPLGLTPASEPASLLSAIRDVEVSPRGGGAQQTTQVTACETDDIANSDGSTPASLGRGYRSSPGGTLVDSSGGGASNLSKQPSPMSTRKHVPAIQVSRVETYVGTQGDTRDDVVNGRPSSAPGPTRAADGTACGQQGFFPPAFAGPESNSNADTVMDGGLSRSAPSSPKRSDLSRVVKNLLRTEDGLAQLRTSLQNDDDDDDDHDDAENSGGSVAAAARAVRTALWKSGRDEAMTKGEAVARAAGQGGAGAAAARLGGVLRQKKGRPASAPSPAAVSKKASVFGGLVQTLVESNSMSWLGTTKLGGTAKLGSPTDQNAADEDARRDSEATEEAKLEILLVDPQGLVRWVIPRLKERRFSVTVAHSAEEAMEMIQEGSFQVAVVDLHMPRVAGTDFCRQIRVGEVKQAAAARALSAAVGTQRKDAGGATEDDDDDSGDDDDNDDDDDDVDKEGDVEGVPSMKLLLHTTSAGSVKSDELEEFLEEGLIEEYVPHPLDVSTLFNFLKLVEEEEEDRCGTHKMDTLLDGVKSGGADGLASSPFGNVTMKVSKMGTFRTPGAAAESPGQAAGASGQVGLASWLLGSRAAAPPAPSVDDVASTFFTVKGRSREAHAAVGGYPVAGARGGGGGSDGCGDSGSSLRPKHGNGRNVSPPGGSRLFSGTAGGRGHTRKVAGPWRPGAAAVSPGLGLEEERGGRRLRW
eukprot:g11349.t1